MAEPEWDTETRDLAMAYDAVDLCPRCGGPAYLCQDPELADQWEGTAPVRCHRYTAILEKQKGFNEQVNPNLQALVWGAGLKRGGAGRGR